jgi:hypothetical protein
LELLVATGRTTTTEVTLPPSCCCTTLLLLKDTTSGAAAGTASVAIPTTCSKFSQFLQESFANSATTNLFSETTKTPLLSSSCLSFFFLLNSPLPLPFFSATAIFATATFSSATLMQQQRFLPQNTKSAKQKMNPFHDHLENYFPQLQKNMKNLTTYPKNTNSRTTLTLSPAIKNSLCNKTKNVCLCNKCKIFLRHKQNVFLCNETGGKKGKKASHLGPLVHGRRRPVGLLYREGLLRKGAI